MDPRPLPFVVQCVHAELWCRLEHVPTFVDVILWCRSGSCTHMYMCSWINASGEDQFVFVVSNVLFGTSRASGLRSSAQFGLDREEWRAQGGHGAHTASGQLGRCRKVVAHGTRCGYTARAHSLLGVGPRSSLSGCCNRGLSCPCSCQIWTCSQ